MKSYLVVGSLLVASAIATTMPAESSSDAALEKRAFFEDSYKIYLRKRNAHACMMSIVFIVLFPLAAISLHLPLRGVRVVRFIHAPIQLLGLAMMIGAMGLGIDIAKNDLNFFASGSPVRAHIVIGLLTTSTIILFQPVLGLLQHRHFKRTGGKSVFAYIHRWIGRTAICLGWINSGLGFQLVPMSLVATTSLVRNFVLMGVLGGLWFLLVGVDGFRSHFAKKQKLSSFSVRWEKGLRFQGQDGEEKAVGDTKTRLEGSSSGSQN